LEKHELARGFLCAGIAASFGTDVYGPVFREGFTELNFQWHVGPKSQQ
jgi:hypothetical protein